MIALAGGAYFNHEGLLFRPVEAKDLDKIRELRNDQSTWMHLTDPRPLSSSDQTGWLASLGSKSGKFYFTVSLHECEFLGLVRMDEYDPLNRSIRIGADVVPSMRGKGYGKFIYQGLKSYCFNQLNCHRVWLLVLRGNAVARHVYDRAKFRVEGSYRDAVFRNGKYDDYIVMSILEDEYRREMESGGAKE